MAAFLSNMKRHPLVAPVHRVIRARLQERAAARIQADYESEAQRRRVACPTGEALANMLRGRLADRRRGREPKAKGQLHVFLAYSVSNWERILPAALAPFGKVSAFEWRSRGFDDSAADWVARRDEMNRAMVEAFEQANREQPVDAVVGYLSGHNTSPETIYQMARGGAAIFNFCWDDKLFFPGRKVGGRYTSPAAIAHAVDLNLTNAPGSCVKYAVHGGLAMFWPGAAHPNVHRPYDLPFEYDVSFVGARYGWRPRFVEQLAKQGIGVECFGNGWPNGPLSDEEMVKLYSRSRINLGFAGIGYSKTLMCIKGRDFEVPMSGGLYVTQHNPELSRVFEIGQEIVTYADVEDCARKIKALLANPDHAAMIRRAGRIRCLRDHTYEARWTQVFEMAGLMSHEHP
jgi:hypothetical protein